MAPTVKKLGLKPGMRALVLGAPSGYMNSLAPLPDRVEVSQSLGSAHEFVQFFATKKTEITKSAKKLLQSGPPDALVWITYPKKTSGVESDLSREGVWAAMEGTGWRPVSQIAIDDVWSALRFRPTQGEVSQVANPKTPRGRSLRVPVRMRRPSAAREAFCFSPVPRQNSVRS
jgi:hypothetical protein